MEKGMKKIVCVVFLMFSMSAFADGFKSVEATRVFADGLMEQFSQKKFVEALNSAKIYWPLPPIEIDGMANQIDQQWPTIDKRFGKYTGREFIKSKKIGSSFVRYYYLHKFENHAIYWQIDFYKPNDQWIINSIKFLDTLENLYE
jgi:hypothetical protein